MTDPDAFQAQLKARMLRRPSLGELWYSALALVFILLPIVVPGGSGMLYHRVGLALVGAAMVALITAHAILKRVLEVLKLLNAELAEREVER